MLELPAPGDPIAGGRLEPSADLALSLGDEPAEVAPSDVGGGHDSALPVLAIDHVRSALETDVRDLAEIEVPPIRMRTAPADLGSMGSFARLREGNGEPPQCLDVVPEIGREANDDREAPVAFVDLTGRRASDGGLDDVLDLRDAKPITRDFVPERRNDEHGKTGRLLELHVGRAGKLAEDLLCLSS